MNLRTSLSLIASANRMGHYGLIVIFAELMSANSEEPEYMCKILVIGSYSS
jgi:hypothetical protein